jgi:DHA1 family multidrug resistance protein-like MFS transporter
MGRHLFILLNCLFVVMTGYGVTLSVLPFHIERMALDEGVAAQETSVHVGVITGLFAPMQFFFAPLWGRLSDRIGRRPVLMIGMLGFAFTNFFFGLSTNLLMLYLSRLLGGSLSAAVLPVAAAFVADLTLESQRGKGMAWMGSAAGLGVMVGPALGGWLAEVNLVRTFQFGFFSFDAFSVPFFAAGTLALVALSATIAWLREPKALNSDQTSIPLKHVLHEMVTQRPFRILLYLSFLVQFAMSLFEGTFALHADKVMGFGPGEMGLVLMVCGLVMAGQVAAASDSFPDGIDFMLPARNGRVFRKHVFEKKQAAAGFHDTVRCPVKIGIRKSTLTIPSLSRYAPNIDRRTRTRFKLRVRNYFAP